MWVYDVSITITEPGIQVWPRLFLSAYVTDIKSIVSNLMMKTYSGLLHSGRQFPFLLSRSHWLEHLGGDDWQGGHLTNISIMDEATGEREFLQSILDWSFLRWVIAALRTAFASSQRVFANSGTNWSHCRVLGNSRTPTVDSSFIRSTIALIVVYWRKIGSWRGPVQSIGKMNFWWDKWILYYLDKWLLYGDSGIHWSGLKEI